MIFQFKVFNSLLAKKKKSSIAIGIQHIPDAYSGGSVDAYVRGIGLVVRASSSR